MTENFHLFLNVIVYFLNFSVIVCMMFIITINFIYFYMLDDIFVNWNMGPIIDITEITKTTFEKENVCQDGYEFLLSFGWPGTKSGCNCLGVNNISGFSEYENSVQVGTCSQLLINSGCANVIELPKKVIHSLSEKYYCVKRSKFNYYSNYTKNIHEGKCPYYMRNCGSIDSLNNFLCVENDTICPIDHSQYVNNVSYVDNFNKNNATLNSTLTNIENHYDLNKLSNLISYYTKYFLQFKLSQGNVCINNIELNLASEKIYELLNKRRYTNCATKLSKDDKFKYDYRYVPLIKTYTDILFYKEDFLKYNILELPNFPENFFNDNLIIYGRNYIGWKKKCSEYIEQFEKLYHVSLKIEQYSIFYLVFSLTILIYCMLFVMIFKELIHRRYNLKIFIILLHVFMILIIYSAIISDYINILKAIDLCLIIIQKRCSDEVTNRLMIFLLEGFNEVARLFLLCIILYSIMLVLSFIKIMLILYKIFKRKILNRFMQGNLNELEMMLIV